MKLRSYTFYFLLAINTIVIGLLGLPLLITMNKKIVSYVGLAWGKITLLLLKYVAKLNYQITQQHLVQKNQPVIVAAKHTSAWETMFLLVALHPAAFVLKKELVKIPIYGWYLPFMGMIAISRANQISAIKTTIKESKKRLQAGFNVIIFPQGTRSAKVSVKPGIYSIHKNIPNAKVLPISHDADKYFGGKGSFIIKPGTIKVKIGKPIAFMQNKPQYLNTIQEAIS